MDFPLASLPYEAARLDALHRLDLLDTPPSEAFDRITRLAAQLFGLPIAAISLTDSQRQWFKSRVGVAHDSIPRHAAPCAEVADHGAILVIDDLLNDACYSDSLLAASGIRFYAGAPLVTQEGYCLGAMCVLGTEPRAITEQEAAALRDLAAMVMAQIELQHALGRLDPVSGLPNRLQLAEDLSDLDLQAPGAVPALAALVDLATPEQLNNMLRVMGAGYLDNMVRQAARLLRQAAGGARKVYQVAPSQFVMVAPAGMTQHDFCGLLEQWLAHRRAADGARFVTSASVGVAAFTAGRTDCNDLLRKVHCAAQDGAAAGGAVRLYSAAQHAAYQRRYTLIHEFGTALERGDQLRLVFQPKVLLASGACMGAEALLRWTHPVLGEVSPAEFIPLIEQTAMARATTAWVLEAAMTQMAQWQAAGLQLQVAVNVSATNLAEAGFGARVTGALARHGLAPARLALEVTESAIMDNPLAAQAALAALDAAGVQIAVDDFGTGYSSLAYLQSLPVRVVKIDRSFLFGIEEDRRKQTLVAAMIALSHELGYRVVAEGVETAAAAALLEERQCDEAQGYLYARPLAPAAFQAWFVARRRALLGGHARLGKRARPN